MTKIFIRDDNRNIIGVENLIEEGEYLKEIIILENKLKRINSLMNLIKLNLDKKLLKKDRIYFQNKLEELKREMIEINENLKILENSKKYNHFKQNDFQVQKGSLEFKPIETEENKRKRKNLNLAYYYCKRRKRDNIMITLEND